MDSALARAVLVTGMLVGAIAAPAQAQPMLATGQLTDARGAPSSGTVVAYAWPLRSGTYTLPEAGRATAGPDGRFSIPASDPAALTRLAGPDGWLDLDVEAGTPRSSGSTVFSRHVRVAAGTAASASMTASVPFLRVAARQVAPGGARMATAPGPCGDNASPKVTKVASQNSPTVVGELNNAYRDTTASFSYGSQADSDIGVGVAAAGSGFSIDGSVHVSTDNSATVSRSRRGPYGRRVLSSFRYGKYRKQFRTARCPTQTIVKAEEWNGGLYDRKQRKTLGVCPRPPRSTPYYGRDRFHRASKRAVTWAGGVSVFGAGLTVRSGFSRNVQTTFEFGGSTRRLHVLCGSGGQPPTKAKRIFSGARN